MATSQVLSCKFSIIVPITSYTSRYVTVYIYIYPMYVYILCVWLTIQPSTFTVWYFIWYVFNFWSAFGVIWAHIACNIDIIPFTLAVIQHFELRLVYYDNFFRIIQLHEVSHYNRLKQVKTRTFTTINWSPLNLTIRVHESHRQMKLCFFLSASSTASTGLNTAFPS